MQTRLLMWASAAFTGVLGVAASFAPHEILAYVGMDAAPAAVLLVQVVGALYLGVAMQNWMARGNTIGGIYSRPLVVGNVVHFTVVAIVLVKALAAGSSSFYVMVGAVAYTAFAVWFGYVMFGHPKSAVAPGRSSSG
jgi:hypothetical protein